MRAGAGKLTTVDMAYIALFAAMIAVCSWISIPTTVPFSMQTFGVFLAVNVLGGRRGLLALGVYLLLGAVGMPVLTGFEGGLGSMLGATGGYLIGFVFSALVMWAMEGFWAQRPWTRTLSMVLGLLVCYAFGTAWFMAVYARRTAEIGLTAALSWCVFPFVLPDLAKIMLVRIVSRRLCAAIRLG